MEITVSQINIKKDGEFLTTFRTELHKVSNFTLFGTRHIRYVIPLDQPRMVLYKVIGDFPARGTIKTSQDRFWTLFVSTSHLGLLEFWYFIDL